MAYHLEVLEQLVAAVLNRGAAQRSVAVPPAQLRCFLDQLGQLLAERGLPPPLAPGFVCRTGGMAEQEFAPLAARALDGIDDPVLLDLAKQVLKACFYPELAICRDSFREVAKDGSCRRQEVARARSRISGAHCVDCPHWVEREPAAHAALLAQEWRSDPGLLAAHQEIFLPEDFRALRRWLYAAARVG
ncbi:hypothetical protein [Horticoccus sp. 23ND18S-11]|uniref:hypothetical protein n=1 Tax=Horticoccus sp. 23ND18S-11 TaxID=3391832 RepID=UPI0039C9A83E